MHLRQGSKKALLYAVIYVSLCTILLYSIFPSDPFAFEGLYDNIFYLILSLFAIPGQLFSWGIRFSGTDSKLNEYILVFVSQLINVFIWWRIFFIFIKRK